MLDGLQDEVITMNEKQRMVLGTTAVALILAVMFFVPWRVKSSDEIKWAPMYRQPVSYSHTYATNRPGSRYVHDEAEIEIGFFLLEILTIGAAGAGGYMLNSGGGQADEH